MLPKEEREARQIWKGTIFLLTGTSTLATFAILAALMIWQSDRPLIESWLTLSFGVFLIGLSEALMQWHNRKQNFHVLAAKNVLERISVVVFSLIFAFLNLNLSGLIWAQLVALSLCGLYMLIATLPDSPLRERVSASDLRRIVSSYRDFPIMHGWSMLFLIGATQLPNLLFGSAFSMEDTGHVNLAYRIFEAPVNLFAVSFATAFYQHISQKSPDEINELFKQSIRTIFKWILPAFLLAGILAPYLFPIIFGSDWSSAGFMGTPLAFMMFFKIVYLSHNAIFLVLRRLDLDLKMSIAIVLAQACGFYAANIWSDSPTVIVTAMSTLSALAYMTGIFLIHKEIGRSAKIAL